MIPQITERLRRWSSSLLSIAFAPPGFPRHVSLGSRLDGFGEVFRFVSLPGLQASVGPDTGTASISLYISDQGKRSAG